MSITQRRIQDHKYLVCAVYSSWHLVDDLTRVVPIGIVLASSPFSAKAIASRDHNPHGKKPILYVASRILGPFQVNMFSHRKYPCEELLA